MAGSDGLRRNAVRIAIHLTPMGMGRWRWSLSRGGLEGTYGSATSYEAAQDEAEAAAASYVEDMKKATSYLYDPETKQRTNINPV